MKPPEGDRPTKDVGGEQWFFINGILTNEEVARMNAASLVKLFHRPIRILYNATDGPVLDLLECASEKLGARDKDVDMAFHPLLEAIADPRKQRVVLIAHSQGTARGESRLPANPLPPVKPGAARFPFSDRGTSPPCVHWRRGRCTLASGRSQVHGRF